MIILDKWIAELNNTLVGTYYIGILGRSSSVYTLNYHTEKVSEDNNVTYKTPIQLNEKKSSKGMLVGNSDYQIFKIPVQNLPSNEFLNIALILSLIHIWRCRRAI